MLTCVQYVNGSTILGSPPPSRCKFMTGDIKGVTGSMTAGGTESILMYGTIPPAFSDREDPGGGGAAALPPVTEGPRTAPSAVLSLHHQWSSHGTISGPLTAQCTISGPLLLW